MKEFTGFLHGVNLGGWLSQCDHTKETYDTFITEKDIENISKWGLDHIRVPIDYDLVETETGEYIESGFDYIQRAIDWCGKFGLNMILDLHKTFGFSFDSGENEEGFFEKKEYQERFYRLWEKLAEKFGKYSDRLAFEILNEVTDKEYCDEWNRISVECIKKIREFAPDIKILIGGYYNNSIESLGDLVMPYDENIVYNFHCYEPLIFTHQGAFWAPGMDPSFRTPLAISYKKMAELSKQYLEQVTVGFDGFGEDEMLSAAYFDKYFEEAVKIAEERNVALYCGEYGVINLAEPEDTLEWYKFISSSFDKFHIGRSAWNYKEKDFGLIDEHMKPVVDEVVKLL
ncbi:MAG: glycoside hydrolase family 5 protein [Eubacterium sp.]|nr:glycoside hydrolase family 5 protein [Eubacterium sp.]